MSFLKDLPDDVKPIAGRCVGLREANSQLVQRLETQGLNIEHVSARLEHFMQALVEAGILPLKTLWEINLGWETNFNIQLKKAQQQLLNMQAEQREKVAKTLTLPQKPRLIVPGQE